MFLNKAKLFQHLRQMYSEAVVEYDLGRLSVKHRLLDAFQQVFHPHNCGILKQ